MSDALEKARDNLYRSLSSIPAAMAIEALVNALFDAREAKAEPDFDEEVRALGKGKWEPVPDPRDARIAELERENEVLDGNYQTAQANWDLTLDRAETAEAALAELRGEIVRIHARVAAFQRSQPMIDLHDNFIIEIRDRLLALTDPEAKEGGGPDNRRHPVETGDIAQPARDTDPVPATDAREAPADYIAKAITEAFGERCPDFDPDCHCCRAWDAYDTLNDMASCALSSDPARAAGITGKGTSDE